MPGSDLQIPGDLADIFVYGLGKVEPIGNGIVRLYFYTSRVDNDGGFDREAVLAMVMPQAELGAMVECLTGFIASA